MVFLGDTPRFKSGAFFFLHSAVVPHLGCRHPPRTRLWVRRLLHAFHTEVCEFPIQRGRFDLHKRSVLRILKQTVKNLDMLELASSRHTTLFRKMRTTVTNEVRSGQRVIHYGISTHSPMRAWGWRTRPCSLVESRSVKHPRTSLVFFRVRKTWMPGTQASEATPSSRRPCAGMNGGKAYLSRGSAAAGASSVAAAPPLVWPVRSSTKAWIRRASSRRISSRSSGAL